jgi:hypothetical protein
MVLGIFLILKVNILLPQVYNSLYNKDYHLIYVDISKTNERQNLTVKIVALLDEINSREDAFLLYLSNGYKPEIISSQNNLKQQKENLVSALQVLNTGSPIISFDKDSIMNIWDKNDIIEISADGKIRLRYKSIYIHYFISSDLLKLEEEEIVDRFLLVKDLTKNYIDPYKICVEFLFQKGDSEGFLQRKQQLDKSNKTGYKYLFTSY